jgi:hypothetical protein
MKNRDPLRVAKVFLAAESGWPGVVSAFPFDQSADQRRNGLKSSVRAGQHAEPHAARANKN